MQNNEIILNQLETLKNIILDLEASIKGEEVNEQSNAFNKEEFNVRPDRGRNIRLSSFIAKEFGDVEVGNDLYTKQRILLMLRTHNINAYCWFMQRFHDQWSITTTRGHRRNMVEQYLLKAFCKFHNLKFVKRQPADHGHNEGRHRGYYAHIHVIEKYKNNNL